MSFKSKDLSYSQSEPAFLRRIRGEIRGSVDDPDRQINPVARPTISKRLKKDEEDDTPTYVLEETNQDLSKEEYEALLKGEEAAKTEDAAKKTTEEADSKISSSIKPKEKIAEIGGLPKKRKAAKIIGQDDDEEANASNPQAGKSSKESSKGSEKDGKKAPKKKKAKTVKLSFGDDEDP